jgi:general secretion pathway protein E
MRRLIHSHAGEHELEAHARTLSSSIRADGIRKVVKGVTTLEEVVRATREG